MSFIRFSVLWLHMLYLVESHQYNEYCFGALQITLSVTLLIDCKLFCIFVKLLSLADEGAGLYILRLSENFVLIRIFTHRGTPEKISYFYSSTYIIVIN